MYKLTLENMNGYLTIAKRELRIQSFQCVLNSQVVNWDLLPNRTNFSNKLVSYTSSTIYISHNDMTEGENPFVL